MENYSVVTDSDKIDHRQWTDFINSHRYGNYFQSPPAYYFLSKTELFQPFVISIINGNGLICGILAGFSWTDKKGFVGKLIKRTVIYGGPVIAENENKSGILDLMLKSLIRMEALKSVYIQFRNFNETAAFREIFMKYRFHYIPHENLLLNTEEPSEVFQSFSESKQRQIKKSFDSGVQISACSSENEVRDFYKLLLHHYQVRVAKPLPSFSFFENFYNQAATDKSGIILLVKFDNEIVGGAVCPIFNHKVISEWYICGRDKQFKDKKIYPGVMATWAIIDYAINNQLKVVDFLGIGKPGEYYGVKEFKTKFGGEKVEFGRYERINNAFLYFAGKSAILLLKKITHLFR